MTERRLDLCRRIMEHLAAVAECIDDPMLRLRCEAEASRLEEATRRGEGWQWQSSADGSATVADSSAFRWSYGSNLP